MTETQRWLVAFTSMLFYLFFVTKVHAQSPLFSENFSSDLSQWQPTRDNGAKWQILDGQVDVVLENPYTITELVPTDAAWNQDWKNLEYELDYLPLAGVDKNISFGFQNLYHWYEIHFAEDFFNLVKVKNGQQPFDVIRPFILQNGQTYRIKIIFNTGLIQVFINQHLVAEEYDSSFDNDYGKVGIKVSTGAAFPTHVRFDNIVVKPLANTDSQLQVPDFNQDDPRWKNLEYDSAKKWSQTPTMARWGCAVTSVTMILHFYHLTHFPDGNPITPQTLNTWLVTQPDGYIGEGLVNWLAVTRLTRLISEVTGTPKLEFKWVGENALATAIVELTQHRPVILNIPDHFVVATGYTGNNQDLFINDPLFLPTLLSEHHKPLLSLRTFIPSQTDLSYVLLVHKPELQVTILNQNGQSPSSLQTFVESLAAEDEANYPRVIQYLPKPESAPFTVTISQSKLENFELEIFAYDKLGNVSKLSQNGLVGPEAMVLNLEYQKELPSSIQKSLTFEGFRKKLTNLEGVHEVFRYFSFTTLNQTTWWGIDANFADQKRYAQLLKRQLVLLSPTMSKNAAQLLQSEVAILIETLNRSAP